MTPIAMTSGPDRRPTSSLRTLAAVAVALVAIPAQFAFGQQAPAARGTSLTLDETIITAQRNYPVFQQVKNNRLRRIGASTAIFSVVNAVLLRPLPYAHSERLAMIETDMRARHVINFPIGPGNMPELRERATAFERIAAIFDGPGSFIGDDGKRERRSACEWRSARRRRAFSV